MKNYIGSFCLLLTCLAASACGYIDGELITIKTTITANSANFDPIHVNVDSFESRRLEPGEQTTFEVHCRADVHEERSDACPRSQRELTMTLTRMNNVLATRTIQLNAAGSSYTLTETSYGEFSISP